MVVDAQAVLIASGIGSVLLRGRLGKSRRVPPTSLEATLQLVVVRMASVVQSLTLMVQVVVVVVMARGHVKAVPERGGCSSGGYAEGAQGVRALDGRW